MKSIYSESDLRLSTSLKVRLLYDEMQGAKAFLDVNSIPHPKFKLFANAHSHRYYGMCRYESRVVEVYVNSCRTPCSERGYSWSYPGWKADVTPGGVLRHELGHWIMSQKGFIFKDRTLDLNKKFMRSNGICPSSMIEATRVAILEEASVSSYEPNVDEVFAEALKVYMINPDLLRVGRPLRYDIIRIHLGIQPTETRSWKEVLSTAPLRIQKAAIGWIRKGQGRHINVLVDAIKRKHIELPQESALTQFMN